MTDTEQLFNAHTHNPQEIGVEIIQALPEKQLPNGFFSWGIHPQDAEQFPIIPADFERFATNPNFKAIGEIGLDSHISVPIEIQEKSYIEQLKIAQKLGKPVILHCVSQWDRCRFLHQKYAPDTWVIYHGFNKASIVSTVLVYPKAIISIGCSILTNHKLADTVSLIPQNRLLVETDDSTCPILEIYRILANKLSIPLPAFIEQINKNSVEIFEL